MVDSAALPALAWQRPGGGVAVRRHDGTIVSLHERGRWPAWSPEGNRLALSLLEWEDAVPSSAIAVYDLHGEPLATPYVSPPGGPAFIAPGVPHYVYWSPTGERFAFVAPAREGLELFVTEHSSWRCERLLGAAPIFPVWSPDGRWLVIHAEHDLRLYDTVTGQLRVLMSGNVAGFRSPAFDSSGERLAFATLREGEVELWRAAVPGFECARSASFPGGITFAFVPRTEVLVVAVSPEPESGAFDELVLVGPEGVRGTLCRGPFAAFFVDPHGQRVALVVPAQSPDGRFQLVIRSLADGRLLAASDFFYPSFLMRLVVGFFDQFSRSHSLWAPDGSGLVVAGRRPTEGPLPSLAESPELVLFWAGQRGAPFEVVAEGEVAFFAPMTGA